MAYTINKTDGSILTTIADGTIDTTTNLSLFGKNYAGYGEPLNENLVGLLENFANTTANAPTKAIKGQLFYDTTLNQMQVYNGSAFKAVSGSIVSTSEPSTGSQGDLWYDSTNEQIHGYTGSSWVLVGPAATAGAGVSGSIVKVITDNTGTDRVVLQLTTSDTIVGMVSSVEFTPQSAISGYSVIKKGITLGTNVTSNKFQGTSTDSDALGGISAASFLRSDQSDTITGTLTIQADASLILGQDGDVSMTQSGANFTLRNSTEDGNIIFSVNDGGATSTVMTLTGSDASVTVANNLTVTGNLTVSGTTTSVNATNTTISDPLIVLNKGASIISGYDGGIIIDRGLGDSAAQRNAAMLWDESANEFAFVFTTETGSTAGNVSISQYANLQVGELTGQASSARYADLAERYEADQQLEPGDVVKLGGEKEITKTNTAYDKNVFGVVSTDPAFKMNSEAGDDATHPYVALSGRVYCKVKGPVSKGDRLTTSDEPGVAQKADLDSELNSVYAVIGRSLESSNDNGIRQLEIVVGKL
jgi:hypothetical protein